MMIENQRNQIRLVLQPNRRHLRVNEYFFQVFVDFNHLARLDSRFPQVKRLQLNVSEALRQFAWDNTGRKIKLSKPCFVDQRTDVDI